MKTPTFESAINSTNFLYLKKRCPYRGSRDVCHDYRCDITSKIGKWIECPLNKHPFDLESMQKTKISSGKRELCLRLLDELTEEELSMLLLFLQLRKKKNKLALALKAP